jgi:hypothetical protein
MRRAIKLAVSLADKRRGAVSKTFKHRFNASEM